ncbi:MAG: aspartyl protease family protein [Sphingomonas sp.]
MISRREAVAGLGACMVLPGLAGTAAAAKGPLIVPIGLAERRVLVAVAIDGTGPYLFMIDTGGTLSLIEDALAHDLKLPVVDSSAIRGVGGTARSALYRVAELSIGQVLSERNLAFHGVGGGGFGKDVRGTLAAGAITSYSSVLDFDEAQWRVYPEGLPELPGYAAVASELAHLPQSPRGSRYIFATVTLDGQPFKCLLDTGHPHMLTLYPEAARRTRYWRDPGVPYAPVRASGVGGTGALSRMVRAKTLGIGPAEFAAPLVTLDGGARGQRFADGVIGLSVLRQLNLATDTRRGRLLIARNNQQPDKEDAPTSGLWVDDKNGELVVTDVGHGSPAATAGITPGDIVVGARLHDFVQALATGAGAEVTMTIKHDGTPRRVTIRLANYL